MKYNDNPALVISSRMFRIIFPKISVDRFSCIVSSSFK